MFSNIIKLIISFGKAGLFGYGGGAGIITMLRNDTVSHGWVSEQEFSDAVAVCYSLPGPVGTQLAGVIGWKVAGFFGASAAIISVILPSLALMFIMMYLVKANPENPIINGIMRGIKPVVFAILILLAFEFAGHAGQGWLTAALGGMSIIALYYFKVNPAFLILGGMLAGGIFLRGN